MKVKEENEKVGLKLNIQKTKIMASGPITSWEIDGEAVADFTFLGSKITANSAAMNIGVHVSFLIMIFSKYMPRNGMAG